jgi:molybdopterin-guanine dinucleotide biosynthesis protein A
MLPTLIILAGGKSSRMGFPKGLLSLDNEYWLLRQINQFIGETILIGLGYDYQEYLESIPWLQKAIDKPYIYKDKKVSVVINLQPELGPFSTLQQVLLTVKNKENILVNPIDVPLADNKTQELIISSNSLITIPMFEIKKGHPVNLKHEFWKTLLELDKNDSESRLDTQIKKRNASKISFVKVSDASCIKNFNTPTDWHEFVSN